MSANSPSNSDAVENDLYIATKKIYPKSVKGRFNSLRVLAVWVLLGLFYVLPWVQWNGKQAILFDLPQRQFHLFGMTLWPQDFIYLTLLLILAAFSLFFFTALAGRLWCGYACPQTVWTETFLWIEKWFEGDRNQRIKLDKGPWNRNKIIRKTGKHSVWLLFSAFTGFVFVGYFTPVAELNHALWQFELGPWETFWILFYGFATYGNAGFLREQICIYMCPYARFQSAMFDRDTLIISYDEERGESRGSRKRTADPKALGLGDCIDCQQCVHVCPTGIDIRDGLQYQCIGCAACIDVCDTIMDKMGYEKGLIRYTTENSLAHKQPHVLRPRIYVYAVLLLSLFGGLVYLLATRIPLDVDIIRDRNAMYRITDDGAVDNVYTLKIMNKSQQGRDYQISVQGLADIQLSHGEAVYVEAGQVKNLVVNVLVPMQSLNRPTSDIHFVVQALDDGNVQREEVARFLAPFEVTQQ